MVCKPSSSYPSRELKNYTTSIMTTKIFVLIFDTVRRKRTFGTIEEMDRTIIVNWNSRVTDRDDVYILGDFIKFGIG